jgi:hypothetical protein
LIIWYLGNLTGVRTVRNAQVVHYIRWCSRLADTRAKSSLQSLAKDGLTYLQVPGDGALEPSRSWCCLRPLPCFLFTLMAQRDSTDVLSTVRN